MIITKQSILRITLEFSSVVFAVLLALGLNAYKQSRDAAYQTKQLKISVINEVQRNLTKIEEMLKENLAYANFLDSLSMLPENELKTFRFQYNAETLTAASWSLLMNTNYIDHLDQEFLLKASEAYEDQANLSAFTIEIFKHVGIILSQMDNYNTKDLINTMQYYMQIMNASAESIKGQYESLLSTYK